MSSAELSRCRREGILLGEVLFEKDSLAGASVPPALPAGTLNESKESKGL